MSSKYKVLGPLGRGGMGLVFRARQLDLDRLVALKIVLPDLVDELDSVRRFRREAEACSALSHPNIIKVLDFGEMEDGRLFFTMELLDAQDLVEVARCGPVEPGVAIDYMAQAADALAYIHARKMLHRDIKPANMMVDSRGHLTVMDFGLVKILGRTVFTEDGQTVGTMRYAAPELLTSGSQSPAQDVYGLAVSIWELVANRKAAQTSDVKELALAIVHEPVPPLRSVRPETPEWFSDLLSRCLEKLPAARPTAEQLVGHLREGEARQPSEGGYSPAGPAKEGRSARPARTGRPSVRTPRASAPVGAPSRPGSVKPWLSAALIGALGLLACVGAVLFRSPLPAPPSGHRSTPAPPGRSASPEPSGPLEVTFPRDRITRIVVPSSTASGRMSLTARIDGGPEEPVSATVTGAFIEIESLPAGAAVTLTAPSAAAWTFTPRRFRTPDRVTLRNLVVLPGDQSALVDADNPRRAPLQAEIGRWREPAPLRSTTCPAGRPTFRWEVGGLRPDTDYFLRVRVGEGWGGIDEYRFRTISPACARDVRMALEDLAGEPSKIHDLTLDTLERFPDARALKRLITLLRDHSPANQRTGLEWQLRVKAARILGLTRTAGIGDELYPGFLKETRDFVNRHYVAALAACRDPRALDLADAMLPEHLRMRDSRFRRLEILAEGLMPLPGAGTVRFLQRLLPHMTSPPWNLLPEAMVGADRDAAASVLLGLLHHAPVPAPLEAWPGIAGAEYLGDEAALAALTPYLDRRRAGPLRDAAVQAIASIDRPLAARVLLESLRAAPADPSLLLAGAQRGLEEVLPLALAAAAPGRPVPVRMAAVQALGLVAGGPSTGKQPWDRGSTSLGPASDPGRAGAVAKLLIPLLADPDGGVRDTACWTLARWKRPETIAALRTLALSPRDTLGRAALALAQLGDRESAGALARTLETPSSDPAALHRQALVAVSLGRLRHEPSRPVLAALASRTGPGSALPSFAGREALRELDAAKDGTDPVTRSRTRVVWIDGMAPVVRTGIRLVPGESLELSGMGFWGWGAAEAAINRPDAAPAPQPGKPPMRLLVRLGRRLVVVPPRPVRYLVEDPGEVVLFCLDNPHRVPPGSDPSLLPSRAVGLVRVTIEL